MPVVVNAPNGPFAANTTPVFTGQLVDGTFHPIPASALNTLTLTIVDTLSGEIINGCEQVNILNTGRGTLDEMGNLTISFLIGDTAMSETTSEAVQRSIVIDWTYNGGVNAGRHQVNFELLALAGP